MATTRGGSITAPAKLTNVTTTNPTGFGELLGLLSDKRTLLIQKTGYDTSTIGVSTDGGATITWGKGFESGSLYKVVGFIETPGGEILISTAQKGATATAGKVWRSTGWNKATANATTWTQVTAAAGALVQYDGRWGFNERCVIRTGDLKGAIVIAEYGTKVSEAITAGNPASHAATLVKISYDDGRTWSTIFDLTTRYPGLNAQLHVHGCAIDHEFQRVMVSYGDGGFSDGAESGLLYCNFEDLDAPVWDAVPGTVGQNPRLVQVTTIHAAKDRIELISDAEVGAVRVINRAGYRIYGQLSATASLRAGAIGANLYSDPSNPNAPRLMTYQITGNNTGHKCAIYRATSGGVDELYRSPTAHTSGRGIINAVGPDVNGKVYANVQLDGNTRLLTGTYTP